MRKFQCEDTGESEHFIFQPLAPVIEVLAGIIVLTTEKTSSDGSTDHVDVACFSGTDLCIPWFWHVVLPGECVTA